MLKWLFGRKEGVAPKAEPKAGGRINRQSLDDCEGRIVHVRELNFIGHYVRSPNGRYVLLWRDGNDAGTIPVGC